MLIARAVKETNVLTKDQLQEARDLHRRAIFINMVDSTLSHAWGPQYFGDLKAGGVTLNNIEVGGENLRDCLKSMAANYRILEQACTDDIILARTAEDILAAKHEGKVSVFFGTQNGAPIEREMQFLGILWRLGLRVFGLAYNVRNSIADGLMERSNAGLSRFGVQVIEELNRLHMVIDLSHVGKASTMEAMSVSKEPVIFSHSNARALYDHPRNIDDEQIKALAEKNGIIGITGFGPAVKLLKSSNDVPTLDDFLDHLDYMVRLAGVDHVGIGLDIGEGRTREEVERFKAGASDTAGTEGVARSGRYEYGFDNWYVKELRGPNGPMKWWLITAGMLMRSYSDHEILKILGGNALRVYKEVWGG
jgi:membrane dipeptidase